MSGSTRDGSIRVVVCDDVAELRELVRLALDDGSGIEVVAELDNGQDAIRLIPDLQPDVVLVDLSMPGLDGLEAIPLIAQRTPRTGIVVFSGFAADRMREPALARGADRYVEKGEPLEVLVAAVREVAAERRRGATEAARAAAPRAAGAPRKAAGSGRAGSSRQAPGW